MHCIQFGRDEVMKAKDSAGSVTLSMAYAGAKFTNVLREVDPFVSTGSDDSTDSALL
jgi:lactate/malate dehydrogenase, alpha/beta C-terminal domain